MDLLHQPGRGTLVDDGRVPYTLHRDVAQDVVLASEHHDVVARVVHAEHGLDSDLG